MMHDDDFADLDAFTRAVWWFARVFIGALILAAAVGVWWLR